MILHHIIKYIINKHGAEVLLDLRLFNILSDMNAFVFEDQALKAITKLIISLYGEKFYKNMNLPCQLTLQQYKSDFIRNYAIKKELCFYVFDSIAYGINWLSQITNNTLKEEILYEDVKHFKCLSFMYHYLGFNITQICGEKTPESYNRDGLYYYSSYKEPIEKNWRIYFAKEQSLNYLEKLNWENKTGIGIICGFNNIRAIDIDSIAEFDENKGHNFTTLCLRLLGLPEDYQWIVRSSSNEGIHIIFKCIDSPKLELNTIAFPSNKEELDLDYNFQGGFFMPKGTIVSDFYRLELIWNGHLTIPPTRGKYYNKEEKVYFPEYKDYDKDTFINAANDMPTYPPYEVSFEKVNEFINYFCAIPGIYNNKYNEFFQRFMGYYGLHKLRTIKDSMGSYQSYDINTAWLLNCNSKEEYNTLGIYYVKKNEYQKAAEYFKLADNDFAHYNWVILALQNHIKGKYSEFVFHINRCRKSTRIPQWAVKELEEMFDKYNKCNNDNM